MDVRSSTAAGDNGFPLAEQPFSDAGMHPRLEAAVYVRKEQVTFALHYDFLPAIMAPSSGDRYASE